MTQQRGLDDVHVVKPGDTLWAIGRTYGYDNPGPIVAYPANHGLFRGRSPDLIRPGERIAVPWRPELVRKFIATSEHLAAEIARDATRLIREQVKNKQELDEFLFKVDAVNFLAGLGVGAASLAASGARGAEMSSKEALIWLVESRAGVASNVAIMTIPTPDAPKRDFKFWVRHALGPWNPAQ